jgi:phosphatidylserine/phosphatidylglycerophosphate/cardiolipin synthase-like enzyme
MDQSQEALLEAIAEIAREVPSTLLETICFELGKSGAVSAFRYVSHSIAHLAQPTVQAKLTELLQSCERCEPPVSPESLAWALRGAANTNAHWQKWQDLELVWTGPKPKDSSLRRTDQAILDVIAASQRELLIVTFAAYKVPEIAKALVDAAHRGVIIVFVVESAKSGNMTLKAISALGSRLADSATIYVWPDETREKDSEGNTGAMHVKCAVADGSMAFISSANLTEYALSINMELGLLVRGGLLPREIREHFRELANEGVLERITSNPGVGR